MRGSFLGAELVGVRYLSEPVLWECRKGIRGTLEWGAPCEWFSGTDSIDGKDNQKSGWQIDEKMK